MPPLSVPCDIVSLRLTHCRAQHAVKTGQWHLALRNYLLCLEAAELRQDAQATQFFALRVAECYQAMGLSTKAAAFLALAGA